MRLTFLGTCASTEPMPGKHHCSFVIEHRGTVHWFDAGETCSRTAHLGGINLLSTRTVFISHTHIDHVGGLGLLLWNLRKLNRRAEEGSQCLSGQTVRVFIPNLESWQGIMQMLRAVDHAFKPGFVLEGSCYQDGPIYQDRGFKVTALHNHHLGTPRDGQAWQSFSFRIEAENSSVVFSGDVASIEDVAPLIDGCDLLLMETGHHKVEDICQYLKDSGKAFGRLGFIHHGRDVLADPAGELQKARRILGDKAFLSEDGMKLDL